MKKQRPVNLDLMAFRFPLAALMSITHRITGVLLFAGVGYLIWLLEKSLSSAQGFADARELLTSPLAKFLLFAVLAALAYHTVAGVRHLIMDMGLGESLEGGRLGAQIGLFVAIVLIVLVGVWLW